MPKRKPTDIADPVQAVKLMQHPLDRLQWMLQTIRLKPKKVSTAKGADLIALQNQVQYFAILQFGLVGYDTASARKQITADNLCALLIRLKDKIDGLVRRNEAWPIPAEVPLKMSRREDGKMLIVLERRHESVAALFERGAFDLVRAEGHRIAKCERHNCDNLLVREGRTVYCSARCSQTARTMKHRHRKALEANEVENV
jgi:hypothetical protein